MTNKKNISLQRFTGIQIAIILTCFFSVEEFLLKGGKNNGKENTRWFNYLGRTNFRK